MSRFRFLAAAAVALACLAPITANAQGATPDPATQAALDNFRFNTAQIVTTLPDNKGVTSEQIVDSYSENGLIGLPSERFNTVMVVRGIAEGLAWNALPSNQRDLIRNFWASEASPSTAVASAP
jgi:hypothetical protein